MFGGIRHKLKQATQRRRINNQIQRMMKRVKADNEVFDKTYSVDTATDVLLDAYDVPEEATKGAGYYQAIHEGVLRAIISNLLPEAQTFDFIDIGSGKGKALLVASKFPFQRVLGVELSPKLHEVAKSNIQTFSESAEAVCGDVSSACIDARELSCLGERTLLFVFNPFDEGPMQAFVKRLEDEARDRTVFVAYLNPRARRPFDESGAFKQLLDTQRLAVFGCGDATISDKSRDALSAKFNAWNV
ncbi:MAG: SAM-dependent methyltransferase [Hyphomonas sp.]|jgi:SAM-dependent methyltransferase